MLKNRREEKKAWAITYRWTDLQKTSETNGSLLGEIKGHLEYHLSRKKKKTEIMIIEFLKKFFVGGGHFFDS